jgi:hypothetical protein
MELDGGAGSADRGMDRPSGDVPGGPDCGDFPGVDLVAQVAVDEEVAVFIG